MSQAAGFFNDRESVAPPLARSLDVQLCDDSATEDHSTEVAEAPLQPIAGFTCVIEYKGDQRLISCRLFETRGDHSYVLAVCLTAKGFRCFRCDRIEAVIDPQTGEVLGDGAYFDRFAVDARREKVATWGLSPSRKATLVAGLNVLAFMAHCDGHWHDLEVEPVERFVCSLWLQREWDGDPPLDEIVAHARRLSPDSDTFFRSVEHYARSRTSTRVLKRAIGELIAADGVICDAEHEWGQHFEDYINEVARRADGYLQQVHA